MVSSTGDSPPTALMARLKSDVANVAMSAERGSGSFGTVVQEPQFDAPPEEPSLGVAGFLPEEKSLAHVGGEVRELPALRQRRAHYQRRLSLRSQQRERHRERGEQAHQNPRKRAKRETGSRCVTSVFSMASARA